MYGKQRQILIENPDKNGFATGYGEHFIPLKIKSKKLLKNHFYSVKVGAYSEGRVLGVEVGR